MPPRQRTKRSAAKYASFPVKVRQRTEVTVSPSSEIINSQAFAWRKTIKFAWVLRVFEKTARISAPGNNVRTRMSVRRLGRATGSRAPSKWIRLGEVLRPGLQARLHVYSRLRGPISQLASRFREPSDDGQNQFHLVPL